MAYVKEDFVYSKMERYKTAFYTVLDAQRIVDKQDDETVEYPEAISMLRDTLENLEGGSVTVKISNRNNKEKAKGGRDYVQLEYQIKLGKGISGNTFEVGGRSDATVVKLMEQITILKSELVATTYQTKLDQLQRTIDDIKNDKSNPLLDNAIPLLMAHFGGGNAAPVAAPHLAGPGNDVEEKNRVKAAVQRWRRADPTGFVETLEMIAELAEKKPDSYNSAKPILKAQL